MKKSVKRNVLDYCNIELDGEEGIFLEESVRWIADNLDATLDELPNYLWEIWYEGSSQDIDERLRREIFVFAYSLKKSILMDNEEIEMDLDELSFLYNHWQFKLSFKSNFAQKMIKPKNLPLFSFDPEEKMKLLPTLSGFSTFQNLNSKS